MSISAMTVEDCKKIIRKRLGDYRYQHSVNVSKCAADLAEKYGADPHKAKIAGILHDATKETPYPEQLQMMERYGILLSDIEKQAPKLWHAVSGACFMEYELGIEDEDILNAVRYHTTARKGMTTLEKVIYIADFISAERDYPGVDELRRASRESLERVMLEGLSFSMCDLSNRKMLIHPNTFEAYNEILLAMKKE